MKNYNEIVEKFKHISLSEAKKLLSDDMGFIWSKELKEGYGINRSDLRFRRGEHIIVDGKECVVVTVYGNNTPEWVMMVEEVGKRLTWKKVSNLSLENGWKIPTIKEVYEFRDGLPRAFKVNKCDPWQRSKLRFWTLIECEKNLVWYVSLANESGVAALHTGNIADMYRSRIKTFAFKKLERYD